ncbi:MAG: ABC transporter permease [Bacilli bacterium]|jgi:multidrug/hemolysin transport system permease protein
MFNIAKRNVLLFFRDKTAVFFSLLSSIIVIVLYALFMGKMLLGEFPESMKFTINSWLIAGLIAISAFTGPLSAYDIMIADRNNNIYKSFIAAPVKKSQLTGGYILSSLIIGVSISLVTLVIGELYIVMNGGSVLPALTILKIIVFVIIGTTANSALLYAITSFIKTQTAYNAFSTIAATLIGFLLGIYVPLGTLPNYVQSALKFYPGTYMVGLLRNEFMRVPIAENESVIGVDAISEFKSFLGVSYKWGSYDVTVYMSLGVLIFTILLFYGLSIIKLNIKRK